MKRLLVFALTLSMISCLSSCQKIADKQLNHKMKSAAKVHLESDNITDYSDLTIECIDTVTEFAYAALTKELLTNMANAYEQQFDQAALNDDESTANALRLYINEIDRIIERLEDLMINGDLKSKGLYVYMVTGNYKKEGKTNDFMFLVNPDKKTLHTIDPFNDNTLFDE